jgi:hypothetical protein
MDTKIAGFFSRHERDIRRNVWIPPEEKLWPRYNEIWRFKLVNEDHTSFHYVKIVCVASEADTSLPSMFPEEIIVCYNRCQSNGLYVSIRHGEGDDAVITRQPFFLNITNFLLSYEKFKD